MGTAYDKNHTALLAFSRVRESALDGGQMQYW